MDRTIKITICYDGTNFSGWQIQPDKTTIQGSIENALSIILKTDCDIIGAGRTDAGVHALRQVAHFKTTSNIPVNNLKLALNSILTKEIAIIDIKEEGPGFHARKSAIAKRYIYRIYRGKTRDPFLWPYTWHLHETLNLEEIRACFPLLEGEHDFTSFSVTDRDNPDAIRNIIDINMIEQDNQIIFGFVGDGFLRKQIRRMVGTLLEVGREKYNSEIIKDILQARDPAKGGPTAPAKGLFLAQVYYP